MMIRLVICVGEKISKLLAEDGGGKPDGFINKKPSNSLENWQKKTERFDHCQKKSLSQYLGEKTKKQVKIEILRNHVDDHGEKQ